MCIRDSDIRDKSVFKYKRQIESFIDIAARQVDDLAKNLLDLDLFI